MLLNITGDVLWLCCLTGGKVTNGRTRESSDAVPRYSVWFKGGFSRAEILLLANAFVHKSVSGCVVFFFFKLLSGIFLVLLSDH